ncbi:MAG: 1-acyl-sn-glycerol-3-phosphate acyltransferase [Eubacteriales bacterium]|nr:1-acyl-sn-glycerol-3-phosphate acyltransferase [Eubacteriales bacterium]
MDNVVRFDMEQPPVRQKNTLRVLTWILSFPVVWLRRLRINKTNMKGLKPPYLLLCTHKSFIDFMVTTACIFPHRANYVVAIDGFIGREKLLRNVGCICKRKFTNDIQLIYNLRQVVDNGDIAVIYPEARYSLIGTNACLPDSLGKLARMLGVPVVMLHMHGNFIYSPVWNLHKRNIRLSADMEQIITQDEIKSLSAGDINRRINDAFVYDEFSWQKQNNVRVRYKDRAKGLHKVLYQCIHCRTEYGMDSNGDRLWGTHCGSELTMSCLGEVVDAKHHEKKLHIPDWYEFLRREVRREIEDGTYSFSSDVVVDSLPNAAGYIRLGSGRLSHGLDGFRLEGDFGGKPFSLEKTPLSMYSCHIEYEYMGKGDCVDLSTLSDTYYIYPEGADWSATKIALATEELFIWHLKRKKDQILALGRQEETAPEMG